MRRGYAWILALLLMLALLTGCGGSGGDNAATEAAAGETMESTASDAAGGSWGAWPEESPAAPAEEGATGGEDRLADAKMIYTGHMEVETTAFEDAVSGLERLVEEMGGYFERAAVHDYGGYRSADYTARVPAERFQDLLAQVGELCHVTYQEQDSDNVSEAYYDTESRLVTQQTKLERLQTLLAQAETMEDIITIESAISETELAIEQLTGTLPGPCAITTPWWTSPPSPSPSRRSTSSPMWRSRPLPSGSDSPPPSPPAGTALSAPWRASRWPWLTAGCGCCCWR